MVCAVSVVSMAHGDEDNKTAHRTNPQANALKEKRLAKASRVWGKTNQIKSRQCY